MSCILKRFNINPENVPGIGDTIAEAGWLNCAGISAASANAADELPSDVKRLYAVKKEDSEGVAQIVQHFLIAPSGRY